MAFKNQCFCLKRRLANPKQPQNPLKTPVFQHQTKSNRPYNLREQLLKKERFHWRLAHAWQLVSPGTFEHGVRLMDEVGRLLGAWLKNSRAALRAGSQASVSSS